MSLMRRIRLSLGCLLAVLIGSALVVGVIYLLYRLIGALGIWAIAICLAILVVVLVIASHNHPAIRDGYYRSHSWRHLPR